MHTHEHGLKDEPKNVFGETEKEVKERKNHDYDDCEHCGHDHHNHGHNHNHHHHDDEEHEHEHSHEHGEEGLSPLNIALSIIGIIILVIALVLNNNYTMYMCIAAYVLIGYDIILNAIKHLFSRDMFDENLIMTIATAGAMAIGEYTEGIAVLVLYKIGEFLNDRAVDSSKDKIESVLNLKEEKTTLKDGTIVDTDDVKIGDIILVKTGDKVPLDSKLLDDNATLDMSALNGESQYVELEKGKEVLSGSINVGKAIYLEVIRSEEDSAVSKIIELVENASKNKSKTEKYISKFCRYYTPVVIVLAILIPIVLPLLKLAGLQDSIYRALNFLVISCPCALVISVPLGFFVGMGAASKKGILAKGTTYLDVLTQVETVFLDKTGTLTQGKFEVTRIDSKSYMTEEEILEYVAYAESKCNHVIATSVVEKYGKQIDESRITDHEEIAGHGVKCKIDGKDVLCGNLKLMGKENVKAIQDDSIGTVIYLAVEGEYKGVVILKDIIKPGSKDLVKNLHKVGVKEVVMLTGDRKAAADSIAEEIGIDRACAGLLPEGKVEEIEKAKAEGKVVAFVGDGINDSPVIAASDIGMAMGRGSDIAVETADIVLMTDEPEKTVEAIKIARRTKKIVNQNITIIILVKIAFLICSVLGITSMWLAVFADVGITILSVLNSLRIFRVKNK